MVVLRDFVGGLAMHNGNRALALRHQKHPCSTGKEITHPRTHVRIHDCSTRCTASRTVTSSVARPGDGFKTPHRWRLAREDSAN
jgi:hypothetical protein